MGRLNLQSRSSIRPSIGIRSRAGRRFEVAQGTLRGRSVIPIEKAMEEDPCVRPNFPSTRLREVRRRDDAAVRNCLLAARAPAWPTRP